MANRTRPTFTTLVYGLHEGGYRASVSINGIVRAVGHATDRLAGEHMARSIKRRLKRGAALPAGVAAVS